MADDISIDTKPVQKITDPFDPYRKRGVKATNQFANVLDKAVEDKKVTTSQNINTRVASATSTNVQEAMQRNESDWPQYNTTSN